MLSEVVCELADTELCRVNGKAIEEMCDTDGAFLEEYQEPVQPGVRQYREGNIGLYVRIVKNE